MKEININIEGYNVNGICVGCLNYDRKMFYHPDIKECFRLIADIDVPDGLSIQVCWECMAFVRNMMRFQEQVLRAYDVLISYSNQHTFLNSPEEFTMYASTKLSTSELVYSEYLTENCKKEVDLNNETADIVVKEEIENKFPFVYDDEFKQEELEIEDHFSCAEEFEQKETISSDEDVQLSELKLKKEKRDKKKKKDKTKNPKESPVRSSRKLKNLPDMVELHTMGESETAEVRLADVTSERFLSLSYKCERCVTHFVSAKLQAQHNKARHEPKGESSYQCDVCQGYFLTKDNLSTHRSLHATAYRCKTCGFITTLKLIMLRHDCVKSEHKGIIPLQCATCKRCFNTKAKLVYHSSVCQQEKPQCDCCGKVFANKVTLRYHLRVIKSAEVKPKESLYIPCKGCNKVFHSKKSYRAHVVIHEGVTYPCPICGKLFQWKRNLSRHTRNHRERDNGEQHECRECGKTFSSRDTYNNHMRLSKKHVGEETYAHECSYCGKKFPTKWCMVDHIDWDHLKRVKYECSVCFKAFKTAKIMVAHMNNIHGGGSREPEGEHLCEICGKSYKTVKRLKGHVWAMHTKRSGGKSYKCKLCSATFSWQTSVYKHVKMMHDHKRHKPPRQPSGKKMDAYPGIELATRPYYQQALGNNLQNIVPVLGIGQNLV